MPWWPGCARAAGRADALGRGVEVCDLERAERGRRRCGRATPARASPPTRRFRCGRARRRARVAGRPSRRRSNRARWRRRQPRGRRPRPTARSSRRRRCARARCGHRAVEHPSVPERVAHGRDAAVRVVGRFALDHRGLGAGSFGRGVDVGQFEVQRDARARRRGRGRRRRSRDARRTGTGARRRGRARRARRGRPASRSGRRRWWRRTRASTSRSRRGRRGRRGRASACSWVGVGRGHRCDSSRQGEGALELGAQPRGEVRVGVERDVGDAQCGERIGHWSTSSPGL